jgi:hypothetical protein
MSPSLLFVIVAILIASLDRYTKREKAHARILSDSGSKRKGPGCKMNVALPSLRHRGSGMLLMLVDVGTHTHEKENDNQPGLATSKMEKQQEGQ